MAVASALAIHEIPVARLLEEGKSLFCEHWKEVAENRDAQQFKLDEDAYVAMDRRGELLVLAIYDCDRLIGYSVCRLGTHLRDTDMLCCVSDAIYLAPAYRSTGMGAWLKRETETQARMRGANCMQWHAMKGSELDKQFAKNPRYIAQDVTYTRRLV